MTRKVMKLYLNHPFVSTLMLSIAVYPIYFGVYTVYAHLLPMYSNLIYVGQYWRLNENWPAAIATFAFLPWFINALLLAFAAKNPFSKYGCMMNKYFNIISNVLNYSVAFIVDALYGEFLLSNHLSMITVLGSLWLIGTAYKVYKARKVRRMLASYED